MTGEFDIKILTQDLVNEAMDFAWENFFPDAPVNRSLAVRRGYLTELWLKPYLGKGLSLVALDKDGRIAGLRAGKAIQADSKLEKFLDTSSLVSSAYMACLRWTGLARQPETILTLTDRLGYYPYQLMERTGAKKIYGALMVCTSRAARGQGLGTRLIQESIALARTKGCEYMYVLVTGNYSAKIFDKLGFSIESELMYNEFVDELGNLLLKDTREHIKAQVRLLKL